jgi:hypothetical protein
MIAFENGRLTEEMFAGRIHELGRQAGSLRARRAEAADAVGRSALAAYVPSVEQLSALHAELRALIESAPGEIRKMVAQAFVHELVVEHRHRILSTFRALGGLPDPRNGADSDAGPAVGGVRTMTPSVGREGVEPPTPCASCKCSNQLS